MKYMQSPIQVDVYRMTRFYEVDSPQWLIELAKKRRVWENRKLVDGTSRLEGVTIELRGKRTDVAIGDYLVQEPDGTILVLKPQDFKKRYTRIENGH